MTIIEGFDDRRVMATFALRGLIAVALIGASITVAWIFALAAIFNFYCVEWL